MSHQLPELPEPEIEGGIYNQTHKIMVRGPVHFTADQMRAYAEQAIASVKREPLSDDELTALWLSSNDNALKARQGGVSRSAHHVYAHAIETAHDIGGGQSDHDGPEVAPPADAKDSARLDWILEQAKLKTFPRGINHWSIDVALDAAGELDLGSVYLDGRAAIDAAIAAKESA
jgi:hypothetical protein